MLTLLKNATAKAKRPKFMKLALGPDTFTRPKKLKASGEMQRVDAKLFYGRSMEVVLPEPISIAIWRYGVFESDVAFYLLHSLKAGDTFIDIGGHFGYFSMLARELVGEDGTVVTFEPMPQTRAILTKNLTENAAQAKQFIIPAAAGDAPAKVKFKDFGLTGSAFATAGSVRDVRFQAQSEVDVDVRKLDDVVKEIGLASCRLIKIDAENAEMQVVVGAEKMLAKFKPNIILETGDDSAGDHLSRPVVERLMKAGYVPYEFKDWALVPHDLQGSYGYKNLLLIHEDNAADLTGA